MVDWIHSFFIFWNLWWAFPVFAEGDVRIELYVGKLLPYTAPAFSTLHFLFPSFFFPLRIFQYIKGKKKLILVFKYSVSMYSILSLSSFRVM